MKCPRCQRDNPQESSSCQECHTVLIIKCSECGTLQYPDADFCHKCRHSFTTPGLKDDARASQQEYTPAHLSEEILQYPSAHEGERKQVTVLFCDLVHSTALANYLGPEGMHTLLSHFFEFALKEVHRYDGTINQFLGDGFMALFGAPLAYEDHAHRAIRTALGLQHMVEGGLLSKEYARGQKVAVRIGINTGLVVVGKIGDNLRTDYTAIGDTTHFAARLQELAEPGTTYLSEQTYGRVRAQFASQSLRTRLPKSKGGPVTIYKLQGIRAVKEENATWWWGPEIKAPMVGRETELHTLSQCFSRLEEKRQGGMIYLLGEPGIGKSRLIAEARRQVPPQKTTCLEGRAVSYSHTISYGPFRDLIKSEIGITEQDTEDSSWEKIECRINALFHEEAIEIIPYLATLLALKVRAPYEGRVKYLGGEDIRRQIFRTCRRFFECLAQNHPLILFFEDMHWADESSLQLMEHLLPLTNTDPLLICWISRLEYQDSAGKLRSLARERSPSRFTEIMLQPLTNSESADLVGQLLRSKQTPRSIRDCTVGKAGGNPFFLEEVVHALVDAGTLECTPGTEDWFSTKELEEITLPDTVQGVIMARVDRLPEQVKYILKLASIMGRHFYFRILEHLTDESFKLEHIVATLENLDLIREKQRKPEREYFFKHALVQEAIYDSILATRRKDLHRQIAECIETLFTKKVEQMSSLLAYHYARAEKWEKALAYLLKAGDQAGKLAADAEALTHYHHAMAAYVRVFGNQWNPVQRASLERKIGEALFRRGDHHQAIECLNRALHYLNAPYPRSKAGLGRGILKQGVLQIGHRLWPNFWTPKTVEQSDPRTEEMVLVYEALSWVDFCVDRKRFILDSLLELNVSEQNSLGVGIAQGTFTLGLVLDAIRLPRLAENYHRRNIAWSEEIQHPRALGYAYLGLGIHEHYMGRAQTALAHYKQAAISFEESGHLRGLAAAKARAGSVWGRLGSFHSAIGLAKEAIRLGEEGADHQAFLWGLTLQSWVQRDIGEIELATTMQNQCIELSQTIPDFQNLALCKANLAKTYLLQGNLSQAEVEMKESLEIIAHHDLRGIFCTDVILNAAEISIVATEKCRGSNQEDLLKHAREACKAALVQSSMDHMAAPSAYCNQGTYLWLCGKTAQANKWWQRAVKAAEAIGMRHKLGLTYLEIGKRTGNRHLLKRAEALFSELDAKRDLTYSQELLEHIGEKSQL